MLRESAKYGPLSKATETELRKLDDEIDKFLDRIKQAKMDMLTNFIIMSDHGMTYGAQPDLQQHDFPTFPHDQTSVQRVYMEMALRLTFIHIHMYIALELLYNEVILACWS